MPFRIVSSYLPRASITQLHLSRQVAYRLDDDMTVSVTIEVDDFRCAINMVRFQIPKKFICDLASAPRISMVQPVRFAVPAIIHDWLYRNSSKVWEESGEVLNGVDRRLFADRLLLHHCRQCAALRAPWRIYLAVRLFGWLHFKK